MINEEISVPREDEVRFIQLYIGEEAFFKAGTTKSESHKQILQRTQLELGLNPKIKLVISNKRTLEGKNYKVVGMGFCWISNNLFYISGESNTYEMNPNKDHLNKIILPKGLEIKILK